MIRAVISLVIVVTMGFATTAYLVSFKLRQHSIRSEVKAMIKNGAPDSLRYNFFIDDIENDPEFTWIHSKEFRYRGDMYDILSKKTTEDGRVLTHCIRDVKESGLFAELDRMVQSGMNGDPQQRNQQQHWHKLFHSLFFSDSDDDSPRIVKFTNQHFTLNLCTESNGKKEPPSPPPQMLV